MCPVSSRARFDPVERTQVVKVLGGAGKLLAGVVAIVGAVTVGANPKQVRNLFKRRRSADGFEPREDTQTLY